MRRVISDGARGPRAGVGSGDRVRGAAGAGTRAVTVG